MVEREPNPFFNVDMVHADLGNWRNFLDSYMKDVDRAFASEKKLEGHDPKFATTLEAAVDSALTELDNVKEMLLRIRKIGMTTGVYTAKDYRNQLIYFDALAQKKFFKCPPFTDLFDKATPQRLAKYRYCMVDALWALNCAEKLGKLVFEAERADEGTYAEEVYKLRQTFDANRVTAPMLPDGDRFNLMLCFAKMIETAFSSHNPRFLPAPAGVGRK